MKRVFHPPGMLLASLCASALVSLAACGGGGTDFGQAPVGPVSPTQNTPPTVVVPISDQTATVGTVFSFDATAGGTAFTDSDGDPLAYTTVFTPGGNGLTANNGVISGIPTAIGVIAVTITASDGRAGLATDSFLILVQSPAVQPGPTPTPGAPNLPTTLFSYADNEINYPPYLTQAGGPGGNVVGADNTPAGNPITNAGATLGRVLFYDKRLSANDTVACASCHQQSTGFSDTRQFSVGFTGGHTGRHSMGLTNARYYNPGRFFWDERAATLEQQVLMPIQDTVEMGMTLPALEQKLAAVSWYGPLFQAAFGSPDVTSDRIGRAMAQFIRSMVSYRSKFDQAMGTAAPGSPPNFAAVFTPQELQGLQIYGGVGAGGGGGGACAACHGTAAHIAPGIRNNGLDAVTAFSDDGAGGGRFKSPSLRNIAVRAPFMHDGRFNTLREVIDFYDSGVQNHPNLDPPLRAPGGGVRRLNLTEQEKQALEAFLHTLTDNPLLTDPRFADPFQ